MSRSRVYRFRLYDEEAERLDREARERGLSKADLIRAALGWDKVDRGPRSTPAPITAPPRTPAVDPERQPGLAGIQQIAERLGGGRSG